jgi:hypothetical protein
VTTTPFGIEFSLLARLKKLFLLLVGALGENRSEQEILLALGDMAIGIFALESALLRAEKVLCNASERKQALLQATVKSVTFALAAQVQVDAARCAAYGVQEPHLAVLQKTIASLAAYPVAGLLEARQHLADAASEAGAYPF